MNVCRFAISVAWLTLCFGYVAHGGTGTMVELLVSDTNLFQPQVRRYDASTGAFRGYLGDAKFVQGGFDPDFDFGPDHDQAKGIGVDGAGRVYVGFHCFDCEPSSGSVVFRFLPERGGQLLDPIDTPFIAAPGKDQGFEGAALEHGGGQLFLSHPESGLIRQFDADTGNPITAFSSITEGRPLGLTVDSFGAVYALLQSNPVLQGLGLDLDFTVPEPEAGRILRLPKSGTDFEPFSRAGGGLSFDDGSAGLAFGPNGDLYVVDTNRDRVLEYDGHTGDFLREFAAPENDGCVDPVGVAFGPQDKHLYVSCNQSGGVARYHGATGAFLDFFLAPGQRAGPSSPTYLGFVSYALPQPLRLQSPPNGLRVEVAVAFRWSPIEDAALDSYRVSFATDPKMDQVVLQLPRQGEPKLRSSNLPVDLVENGLCDTNTYYWSVSAQDDSGNNIGTSQEVFSFVCDPNADGRGFTLISGLIQSNRNGAAIAGANVFLQSATGAAEATVSSISASLADGSYLLFAATRDNGEIFDEDILVVAEQEGFVDEVVMLSEDEKESASVTIDFLLAPVGEDTVTFAAVTPVSRSVQVGNMATAFASIVNGGENPALSCRIALEDPLPTSFTFQTTDPLTNAPTGTPNTPADIPVGGTQSYVISFTPSAPFAPAELALVFDCANAEPPQAISGVNTFLLSASSTPVMDVISAFAVDPSTAPFAGINGESGTGAFSIAALNVGISGNVTAIPRASADDMPLTLSICQLDVSLNPVQCLAETELSPSATNSMTNGVPALFVVVMEGQGMIEANPANHRVVVEYRDEADVIRGATSVAVRTIIP